MSLIKKYNVPGPRYTSYPTVPYWNKEGIALADWQETLIRSFEESNGNGISIYIHLPFCENLCTFCGCHKKITKRHGVEDPYIKSVLKEWQLYVELLPSVPNIKEIHLGGGTPTFFSPDNLKWLITGILEKANLSAGHEFSFEGHPNNTTKEHLQVLYDLGFKRVSFGVQDYDPQVQLAINRIQPFEHVKQVTEWSREIGYTSISHDLVFGLPHQKAGSIRQTIDKTNELKPDRIAFYSYAHVPWIKGVGQRGFDENDLPKDEVKRELYEIGKQMFDANGYVEIGMDHFALRSDSMYKAMVGKTLHRNFMGYTTNNTQVMIGLGMSSISDAWYSFAQNSKDINEYQALVDYGQIPIFKGHLLTDEDLKLRKHILNLMCQFETDLPAGDPLFPVVREGLEELINDGLVELSDGKLTVFDHAVPFIRNVCMAFDMRLRRNKPATQVFSKTI